MTQRYFFENDKISYPDLLKTVELMLKRKSFSCEKECIEVGIAALDKLDENSQSKLIDVAYSVDRIFYVPGESNRNSRNKLPIILKCADLLANLNEKVADLTKDELVLISYYYSFSLTPYDDKRLPILLDKELLKSVENKTNNLERQFDILTVVDMKLEDLGVNDINNDEQNKFIKKEMINMINNNSVEEILSMIDVQERLTQIYEASEYK